MTVIAANAPVPPLKRFMTYSLILHGGLLTWIGISAFWHWRGSEWTDAGSGGDTVNVSLVTPPGGALPMPQPPTITESKTVDPSKSLYQQQEPPKPPEPPTEAKEIPKFDKDKPLPPTKKSKVFENKTPTPDNAVAGPSTGAPHLNTGYNNNNPGSSSPGIVAQGAGGDFASRYSWYIAAVKRRIQGNWQQYTIDPSVRAARTAHAVVQFTIARDGSIKDVQITQSSGNQSMDYSGLRAIQSSNPMPALPNDYSGTYVNVIFDFDLSMTQ